MTDSHRAVNATVPPKQATDESVDFERELLNLQIESLVVLLSVDGEDIVPQRFDLFHVF